MTVIRGKETIQNPLQCSALNKKGLCDYVINVASGCLHGCTFCYVPSTPAIRVNQSRFIDNGVNNPQMDWGSYLFRRENIPEILSDKLSRMRTWKISPSGQGVVMLCSGTDPYQNREIAKITRETIRVLIDYDKKVRVLTRSPLWVNDLDLLTHPNVSVGMSLPHFDDELSRRIEPQSPVPSTRWKALLQGYAEGCRLYIAMAPTPPQMTFDEIRDHLERLINIDPEVIFWEPINARGTNGKRMKAAGLEFVESVMDRQSWAENFIHQWCLVEEAARDIGCLDKLHIWVDPALKNYVPQNFLDYWFFRQTNENWMNSPVCDDAVRPEIEDYLAVV